MNLILCWHNVKIADIRGWETFPLRSAWNISIESDLQSLDIHVIMPPCLADMRSLDLFPDSSRMGNVGLCCWLRETAYFLTLTIHGSR